MTLGHLLRISAFLVIVFAFLYAVAPFTTSAQPVVHADATQATQYVSSPDESLTAIAVIADNAGRNDCHAALIDAWHAKSMPTGWFGYAPLTPVTFPGTRCRSASQHRLQESGAALLVGIALLFGARAIDRRSGFGSNPPPAAAA